MTHILDSHTQEVALVRIPMSPTRFSLVIERSFLIEILADMSLAYACHEAEIFVYIHRLFQNNQPKDN